MSNDRSTRYCRGVPLARSAYAARAAAALCLVAAGGSQALPLLPPSRDEMLPLRGGRYVAHGVAGRQSLKLMAVASQPAPVPESWENLEGIAEVNWLVTGALVLGGLLAVCMLIYIGKVLLRVMAFAICLGTGVAGIVVLSPWLQEVLLDALPPQVATHAGCGILAHVLAFLGGYITAIALLSILGRPLRASQKRE